MVQVGTVRLVIAHSDYQMCGFLTICYRMQAINTVKKLQSEITEAKASLSLAWLGKLQIRLDDEWLLPYSVTGYGHKFGHYDWPV